MAAGPLAEPAACVLTPKFEINMGFKIKRTLGVLALVLFAPAWALGADEPSNGIVNLNFPDENRPLTVRISNAHSRAYRWAPGERVYLTAFSKQGEARQGLRDAQGQELWGVTLDGNAEGSAKIFFDEKSYTGPVEILANGELLPEEPAESGISVGRFTEKIHEYRFDDGTHLKVHFTDQSISSSGASEDLPSSVMDAAVMAYQTITQFEGFNTPGYAFAAPDKGFAYDPDQTIDIYLGNASGANGYEKLGPKNKMFKDAPCFDTVKSGPTSYDAVILLPANYHEFIRNWEKINPSPLGKRNVHVDLRGTLIHEMLHVILFYYNKNLNKAGENEEPLLGPAVPQDQRLDWYVEGLARYFETFAGARHDFYSQGFKQTLPDKIRFSRGGSNYYMRYPDQAFTQLRYENALFWRFVDHEFGMTAIEEISRDFRGSRADFKKTLEKVTGEPFESLLGRFAAAVLFSDFGLKEDAAYLNEIAKTRFLLRTDGFYLLDGQGKEKHLGSTAATDWIGSWENSGKSFGEPSAAGDTSEKADVSGWATDFVEISCELGVSRMPDLSLRHEGAGQPLMAQTFVYTKGGSILHSAPAMVGRGSVKPLGLPSLLISNSIVSPDAEKIVILITNTDPSLSAAYEFSTRE